jgi:hypothetical protein
MIMKRYLLSFLVIACAFLNKSNAQCKIIDITTSNFKKVQKPDGSCQAIFDMVIVAQLNNGNKGIWIHFWDINSYPTTPWNYANGSAPSATFLTSTLGTLGVNNSTTPPQLLTSYPFDPTPPVKMATANTPVVTSTGSGANTIFTYLFNKVTLDLPTCVVPEIKADVWSTQASSLGPNTKTSCSFPGRSLNIGDLSLSINGPLKRCPNNSQTSALSFDILTDTANFISVSYDIRKDDNQFNTSGDRVYDPTNDVSVISGGTQTISISSGSPFNALNYTLFNGYNNPAEASTHYWIVATYTPVNGTPYSIASVNKNDCAQILPVSFKSFTASRANAANTLKWTTSTEVNNKGFYIQRFYNGQWTNVMFVATKAENGNSSSDLNYSVNDVFNFKGVVQYRIQQVDIDGRSKYSDVRSLSSVSQAGNALVYPNPAASNGNVSIILADATSSYDIHIIDNAGRIVKQFTAVRGNQQVSGLPRGQYMARVMDKVSGESTVDKFIVQ